ncbi:MAG: Ribose import ATP-binding protein RbsA [Planctomycetes bacterium ADurb.Bin126]|nr:MAG: Ribose import ATP-binding protein RbsA [Planctomycetes bacterium ADurb.Bin126]
MVGEAEAREDKEERTRENSPSPRPPFCESPLLSLERVTKRFGGVTALNDVSFELLPGEIHALLGENGAGKSTLIKVLGGIHAPDAGTIRIDDRPVHIRRVADADRLGIRIIHQELSLAPNLTVAENIYMGREPACLGCLRRAAMRADARALVRSLHLDELDDVDKPVSGLTVAHRQLVEIARALSCQARVLVLDEPTSSLSEAETEALFTTLRRLRGQGVGIIYISHRLEEILRLADRITVLRDGQSIGTQPAAGINRQELVRWMVGRDIHDHFHRPPHKPGRVALSVRNLRSPTVDNVSFDLHYGEVLGLAGLVGSGRTELARALFGIDRVDGGQVLIDAKPVALRSPRDALAAGMVMISEDRKKEGLFLEQSVGFNLALPWVAQWIRWGWPSAGRREAIVRRAIAGFGIKTPSPECGVATLSGGNQQKVVVGRWMERRPKVLILDEPTRGVDVGAREEMFAIISRLVEEGTGVLLISSDLSEVLNMSHRVALYRDDRILQVVPAEGTTPEQVMAVLTGART